MGPNRWTGCTRTSPDYSQIEAESTKTLNLRIEAKHPARIVPLGGIQKGSYFLGPSTLLLKFMNNPG